MTIKKLAAFIIAAAMLFGISVIPSADVNDLFISVSATSKLSAPSGIKAAAGTDKITLTWDKVNGADAYRVYMYDSYSKKFKKIKTATETKATITGLLSEESYRFMLSAVKKNGKTYTGGEFSKEFKVTTKSIGSKNLVLTEYYNPNMEKGSDVDYFFEYDNDGRIASVKSCYLGSHSQNYEFKGDISRVLHDYKIEYLKNKIIMTDITQNNTTIKSTITYNNNFDITSIKKKSDNGNYSSFSYSYDKNNNLISETYIRNEKDYYFKRTIKYTYDKNNKLISKKESDSDGFKSTNTYTYDKNNNLISEKETVITGSGYKSTFSDTYTYDKNNILIKSVNQDGDVTLYSYDKSGNVIRRIIKYKNNEYGRLSEEWTYNYYKCGKLKNYTCSTTEKNGKTNTWFKPYYVYKTINKEIDEKTEKLNDIVISYFT
ncbi:MAG: fibronectin type III domain-containing protein [Oscillospiraceae bacterium]